MTFDEASTIFELYIDWERRLKREIPFLVSLLRQEGAKRIADVACGTGKHATALAEAGFQVTGMDPDPKLLDQARVPVERAAFADLPGPFAGRFDAALCLGNSLALVPAGPELEQALQGLAGLVKPGGIVVAHTINFPMLARRGKDPWGPVRVLDNGDLVMKGFLPQSRDRWDALLIHLERNASGAFDRRTVRFTLYPHTPEQMRAAGLVRKALHGGFSGESHDAPASADLVYLFQRIDDR
jgi:SAM-dependent methyltransferase